MDAKGKISAGGIAQREASTLEWIRGRSGWYLICGGIAFLERRDGGPEHPDSDLLGHARCRPYDAAAPDGQHRRGRELDGRVNWSTSRKNTGCQEFHANSRTKICLPVFTICAGTRRK